MFCNQKYFFDKIYICIEPNYSDLRITLSLSHCCWYFPTWSPKQFPVIWLSWIALGKTMNGNEWRERERERAGWTQITMLPICQAGHTQYQHNTIVAQSWVVTLQSYSMNAQVCLPKYARQLVIIGLKWCRMSVDHNVKPLQSTTLHQSWDPSLTRLIHTGQTRLLGYMDDQGRRGGGGYFWCLFWLSLAPH